MSAEVSGEPEGVTLIEAIEAGRVETPGELSFTQWQAWRRGPGQRPTVRRDGRGLSTRQEVDLWRSVMAHLYGEGRATELEDEEGEPGEAEIGVPALENAPAPASYSPSVGSGGRGGSPRASSVLSGGGASVSSLQAKLKALYDPKTEDLGTYLMRMGRTIEALTTLDAAAPPGALEKCTRKAELMIELYAELGELDRAKAVRFLREKFLAFARDMSLSAEERDLSIASVGEVIEQLGGKPSSSSEKLFSTPSDLKEPPLMVAAGGPGQPGRGFRAPDPQQGKVSEEDRLRAKLAAMEMELEGLKHGKPDSEVGSSNSPSRELAAALEEQTKVLKEALVGKGSSTSVTTVKADLHWPTLSDERSDAKDVNQFYEDFEDVCALANNCRGMTHREMLVALRGRCRGSRLQTYRNVYKAAWQSGEVLENPAAVYARIKSKHLMFSESREEREIRVDGEHASLVKGKLTGGQFEPLFEASVTELEAVGLGKTPRELFLSYLRKVGTNLQKEIRADKRLWGSEDKMRGPQTWEEAHRVVLEYEQREATARVAASTVYTVGDPHEEKPKGPRKEKPKPSPAVPVNVAAGDPRKEKLCWDFRDHGTCRKGRDCPFSHDKELRKRALEKKGNGKGGAHDAYPAKNSGYRTDGKGKGKGKGKNKGPPKEQKQGKSQKPCPFFFKKGACKKGDACDMSHALVATNTGAVGADTSGVPAGWGAPSGSSALKNPFGAFIVVTCGPGQDAVKSPSIGASVITASTRPSPDGKGRQEVFTSLDQLPKDWWHMVENDRGGYQYKTVTKVLDRKVETLLDGGAGSNHITEELILGILNRAAELGLKPQDPTFPIVQFEQWLYPEFVHGIASGSPVPLRGSVVLKVVLQEGVDVDRCVDGHMLYIRCKIAAKGTSDWHGLILGGRALDCEARRGLGFRPGPKAHVLDSLGVQIPRCEDCSVDRKDRAYVLESVISAVESTLTGVSEPCTGKRSLLVFAGDEEVHLAPGEGALVPVTRSGAWTPDASLCEAVLPIDGKVEAVPGLWNTGREEGMVLVTPRQEEVCLERGDEVAELRSGHASSGVCQCGALDAVFGDPVSAEEGCQDCGFPQVSMAAMTCQTCGTSGRFDAVHLQGCRHGRARMQRSGTKRGVGMMTAMVGAMALGLAAPSDYAFSAQVKDTWASFPGGWVKTHQEAREELYVPWAEELPEGRLDILSSRRVTSAHFRDGSSTIWEDDWQKGNPWVFKGQPWVGETRFFKNNTASEVNWRSTITEPVFHIVETAGGIDRMAEETPTDHYYDCLRKSLEEKFPKADRFLLDHLVSLEAFLDKSIVFGFSFGVTKAELVKTGGKLLGHLIGREGSSPDPERAQAVRDFAPLREKLHVQQFLGCANWLRAYLPAEFGCCAKVLTGYQKPGATFPPEGLGFGQTPGCKAVRSIKRMLAETISLSILDEAAAISGQCPLEQIADASGYAVGGTVLQMTRDMERMKVLLTHSKALTPPQQSWPPLIQEAFAQLEVKRMTRKTLGSIRTICWTDHANLTKAQHIDVGADVKLVRWVAEILSDGSEIRSLSGRSAKLGDGFSRNPKERDELLQNRTKDLEGLAGQLKGFNLEEYLGDGAEDSSVPVTWGIGDDAIPDTSGDVSVSERHAVGADQSGGEVSVSEPLADLVGSIGARPRVKVLVVADYCSHGETAKAASRVRSVLSHSMPGWDVVVAIVYGAFEDDAGSCAHLDGATARLKGDRQVKRARVDLLTSCATVLRSIGNHLPDFLVGFGQGGLIAGMVRFPLLVEVTLQARNLQKGEVWKVVSGWAGLKAIWSCSPRIWKTQTGVELLLSACPELQKQFPIEPVKGFAVCNHGTKEAELSTALQLSRLKSICEVPLCSLAKEPSREVWEHSGRCACGRRAYVFGRCVSCIERESADDLRVSTESREKELEAGGEEGEEGELLVEELMSFTAAVPKGQEGPLGCFVPCTLVLDWAKSWISGGSPSGFHDLPRGHGCVAVWAWRKGEKFKLPTLKSDSSGGAYGATWAVHSEDNRSLKLVTMVQQCQEMKRSQPSQPVWELGQVNWFNHVKLLSSTCDSFWSGQLGLSGAPSSFKRLIGLLGNPSNLKVWDDGVAAASIGNRRDLRSRKVLVVFQKRPSSGYWFELSLGRKVKVDESSSRPTIAVLGCSWDLRIVVHMRSKHWILPRWVGAEGVSIGAVRDAEEPEQSREELAEEARLQSGLCEFEVTGSLRGSWYEAQRKDESLVGHFRRPGDPFRIANDGLLERSVVLETGEKVWVPVIPGGFATANGVTWRRCCFNQAHHGALGGHRSSDRTFGVLARRVWWSGIKEDVKKWTERCLTCLKARAKPKKVTAGTSRCLADFCWQEVSVDCEGPNREDRWGFRYSITYMDCLSHAVMIEPVRSLSHAEVRRAFAKCIFRSRTIPKMVRSDRGVEFRNAMMAEFCALMGVRQKFSMAMRPCEMGSNERMHQEVQKVLHVIIKEVVHGEGDEWSDLLPLVEYVLDNTPGPHGYTPRDLERSWSLGLDLEKDLIKESLQFELVSDWGRRQFGQFQALSKKVAQHWEKASAARARLANRYRRNIEFQVGDRVVWDSPVARPEGAGRVPWKRGLTGPWEVISVSGHKLRLRSVQQGQGQGREVEAHAEDCVLVPDDVEDPVEVPGVLLEEDPADAAPSIGQRIAGEGEQREFVLHRRGRQFVLRLGDVVAYSKGRKICQFGRVTQVSAADGNIGVHKFRPRAGDQLRVKWLLSYLDEEGQPSLQGSRPEIEQIRLKDVVTKADISKDGILAAATSRRLDKSGYKLYEERPISTIGARTGPSALDLLDWLLVAQGNPQVLPAGHSSEGALLERWLRSQRFNKVGFLELYAGHAGLTVAAREADVVTAPPIDQKRPSYGREWDLRRRGDRELVNLLISWLEPEVVHIGLPCEPYSRIGAGNPSSQDSELLEHAVVILRMQRGAGRHATLENPVGSLVFQEEVLVQEIGSLGNPSPPWSVCRTDGCQFGMVSQATNDGTYGMAVEKGQLWVSSRCMSSFSVRCKKPDSLAPTAHQHRPVRGQLKVKCEDGQDHWVSSGVMSGIYTPACCKAYWHCMLPAVKPCAICLDDSTQPRGSGLGVPDLIAAAAEQQVPAEDPPPKTDVDVSGELTAQERVALERELSEFSAKMTRYWDECGDAKKWDEVKADLAVYRLSGQKVVEDPRRSQEYRQQVVDGLGFGKGEHLKTSLSGDDLLACRDVLFRKAAAFWLEGTPRTTVRNVAHDCVPTGPPISLQPHSLKGESAAWVDERLEEEVQRGQLVRGSSAWGSPPFPTKEAPTHKRHRKRRLVVDYRRVNARVLRSTYYCRKASDVLSQCSGSIWYSFVDAVTGFNQVANTRRAMEILAIVARSGKFLPVCLTFGPVNGPDDFCFVVDRAYGPGRGRRNRFNAEWVAYIDDITVRTGRSVDGQFKTDSEHSEEIKNAMRQSPVLLPQTADEAITALGIKARGVGVKGTSKHDEKVSDHNHPTRCFYRRSWFRVRTRVRSPQTFWVHGNLSLVFGAYGFVVVGNQGLVCQGLFPQLFGSFPCGFCLQVLRAGRDTQRVLCEFTLTRDQAELARSSAGWACASQPIRGNGSAGQACGSRPARDLPAMGKGGKGKGRRDPRTDWSDLEFLLCKMLRHGESRSAAGRHSARGRLAADGWFSVADAAHEMRVSESDILQAVRWQPRKKVRMEVDRTDTWVRALQGHTPDSGLSQADFYSEVALPDGALIAHGTLRERVPSILQGGLLAAGGGTGEGRLFVHWSSRVLDARGAVTGVRSGSDAIIVTSVGKLRAAGITLKQGNDGVILSGDVSPDYFIRVSCYGAEHGEGEVLWTLEDGLVPVVLPTGDTDSSSDLEIRVIRRAEVSSSGPGRGSVEMKTEPSEAMDDSNVCADAPPVSEARGSGDPPPRTVKEERPEEDISERPSLETISEARPLEPSAPMAPTAVPSREGPAEPSPEEIEFKKEVNAEVVYRMSQRDFTVQPYGQGCHDPGKLLRITEAYAETRDQVRQELEAERQLPEPARDLAAAKRRVRRALEQGLRSGGLETALGGAPRGSAASGLSSEDAAPPPTRGDVETSPASGAASVEPKQEEEEFFTPRGSPGAKTHDWHSGHGSVL